MKALIIGHCLIVDANRIQWADLTKNEVEVDLVCPRQYSSELEKELEYKRNEKIDHSFHNVFTLKTYFSGKNSYYFFEMRKLYEILRRKKYDIILVDEESWSISLFIVNLLKFLTKNRSSLMYIWATQNMKKKHLYFFRHFEKINTFSVKRILGCCDATKEVFEWKNIKKKWSYLPHSFSKEIIDSPKIKIDRLRLGYIGRLDEEKGMDDLIAAFKCIRSEHIPNVELIIAGAGEFEEKLKSTEGVKVLGRLNHLEVKQFYDLVNVVILPSRTKKFWMEQFGRTLVEAVASKRLIIGSSSGAIPEVLSKMGIHAVFKEGDIADLVRLILRQSALLKSDSLFNELERREKLCLKNFESKSVMNYLYEIFKKDALNE